MKKHWRDIGIIVLLFCLWRLLLVSTEWAAPHLWPLQRIFLGPTHWANFDGVHYLFITQFGYRQYMHAFFPFYPMVVRWVSTVFTIAPSRAALEVSLLSFMLGLAIFYRLAKMEKAKAVGWSTLFLLSFPVSFFFAATYTTSLYFLLAAATLFCAKTKRWLWAGLFGSLASATQLFGVFLLLAVGLEYLKQKKRRLLDLLGVLVIPVGLIGYMVYLSKSVGDPLAFYNAQPFFGAQRSANEIILLPQVVWRYIKIFTQSSWQTVQYWVAALEFGTVLLALWLLWRGFKEKISSSYLLYSAAVIVLPTVTGTLSSVPRYLLSAFPLFFVLGALPSRNGKIVLAVVFGAGLVVVCSLFLQGYFVS